MIDTNTQAHFMTRRPRKIIVFGGSGFVGRHLLRRLSVDGHQATVITRYAPGARALTLIPGVRLVQADPHDKAAVIRHMAGHDTVINLVGILNERGFDGSGFRRAHVELVENLLEGARSNGIRRLLHMSGLNAGKGESYYLKTRGEAEALIDSARRDDGLEPTVFQPSTIFGPDDSFLNRFATLLRISPVLPLARSDARMAPVYIEDVVDAFAHALERPASIGQTYQLCGPRDYALGEIVTWLRDQLGLRRMVLGLPDWAGKLQARVFDFVPGKPFSSDNFRSLLLDSVCASSGFQALGIEPRSMELMAPLWLSGHDKQYRYQEFRRRARPGDRGGEPG